MWGIILYYFLSYFTTVLSSTTLEWILICVLRISRVCKNTEVHLDPVEILLVGLDEYISVIGAISWLLSRTQFNTQYLSLQDLLGWFILLCLFSHTNSLFCLLTTNLALSCAVDCLFISYFLNVFLLDFRWSWEWIRKGADQRMTDLFVHSWSTYVVL